MPEGTEVIMPLAFAGYSLTTVTLPDSLKVWWCFEDAMNPQNPFFIQHGFDIYGLAEDHPWLETVIGTRGSYAERFAQDAGIWFVDAEEAETLEEGGDGVYNAQYVYNVRLDEVGSDRIAVIRVLRKERGLTIMAAKTLLEEILIMIQTGFTQMWQASHLVQQLTEAGAKAAVKRERA